MRKQSHGPSLAIDDVHGLLIFARVVELRSFSAAARELGTTTSAVSKRIARLEERVGVRLLARSTRRVSPSEAGIALYGRCARILREVEDAELAVSAARPSGKPRGLLRVTAPVTFGEAHVAPLLGELMARYPEIRVDLSLEDRFVDLLAEGYDVAVRIGKISGAFLVARRLARIPVVMCASPAYLASRGEPRTPADLLHHDCLRYTLAAPSTEWALRGAKGEKKAALPVTGGFRTNHGGALREAALAGVGIALLPRLYVDEALARGTLRTVLDAYAPPGSDVHGIYAAGPFVPPKIRAFIDLLAQRLPARLAPRAAPA